MTPELFERITRGHSLFITSLPDTKGGGFTKAAVVRSAAEADLFVKAYDRPTQSTYYSVGHLREGAAERRKETVAEISCVWADIDFKQHPDLSPEEIDRRLGQCHMPPTRIVHSVGARHVYWDLHEPVDVTDPAAAREIEEALKLAASFVGGDPAVCEVARLMRLPGSHNSKYGDLREVRILAQRNGGYELADLVDGWLEDAPVLPPPVVAPRANGHDRAADPYEAFARSTDAGERLDLD